MQVEEGYVKVDPLALDIDVLEDALWRIGKGKYKTEAALLLLSFHGHWLRRAAFRSHVMVERPADDPNGPLWASVDWEAIAGEIGRPYDPAVGGDQMAQSSSRELRVLRIAASLGGGGLVDLSDVLDAGFDQTNARLVQAAVVHAMQGFTGAADLWPVRP